MSAYCAPNSPELLSNEFLSTVVAVTLSHYIRIHTPYSTSSLCFKSCIQIVLSQTRMNVLKTVLKLFFAIFLVLNQKVFQLPL